MTIEMMKLPAHTLDAIKENLKTVVLNNDSTESDLQKMTFGVVCTLQAMAIEVPPEVYICAMSGRPLVEGICAEDYGDEEV